MTAPAQETQRTRDASAQGRIRGHAVPLLLPADGPVHVLVVGEAPGPRGADQSGVPFYGDAAGALLYAVMERLHAVELPEAVGAGTWDGARFAAQGWRPRVHGIALGNAFDRCPTDDGHAFRAPTRAELEDDANMQRLRADLSTLIARGLVGVVTLGRVAARTYDRVLADATLPALRRQAVPHPSAQGLLSMAPDRGKGARMADLRDTWMHHCAAAIVAAGFPRPRDAEAT